MTLRLRRSRSRTLAKLNLLATLTLGGATVALLIYDMARGF